MSRPFEWGRCDCCTAACDVFAALWGFDPMAPVRGYHGAREAAQLMARPGGLAALADDLTRRAGLREGHAVGGLAIVTPSAPSGRPSILICIEPGFWAGKSPNGFAILRCADKGWHA
ncbi:DUF6950 family protein [Paracoccus alcaliphilus]|uniref:DUF6950 family protein n=1 Tax=Paracoccus alcaliphilus TaxID=34002 RepID=UPI0027A17084|nr:hypothetical protein JHW40_01375 [Paracoccus alcaliphilus]